MENNNVRLIRSGNSVYFSNSGFDYELEPGVVYTPDVDKWSDEIKLTVNPNISIPENYYETNSDRKFINKVLNYYNGCENNTTGVLLAGVKGTGKTIMAKKIALESKLPIIIIDKSLRPSWLKKLFNKFSDTGVCVIFDEFDKLGEDYDDDYILQVFDGISGNGKKLVLLTCNNTDNVNEFMLDRCSRIRYYREFEEMSVSMVESILNDRLNDKTEVKAVCDFINKNFGLISFDNVAAFAEEVNNNPKDTFEELFNDMNISSK